MSLENQVTRVSQGMKDTLKTLINKLGGNVTDELIDQYPSIASALDDVEPAGSAQQALIDAKSYTDQKILEVPTPDVSGQIGTHNADASAHADIRSSISNHTSDTDIHVTAEEKATWNAKADALIKPEDKPYLTFNSPNSFTLAVSDATKHWDGTLEYSTDVSAWSTWDGTTTLSSVNNDGEYVLYLRGTGNTVFAYSDPNGNYISWVINGTDVRCNGNIETLLDYATVEAGQHPTMELACYMSMFSGCTALTQAPALLATTLTMACYAGMFSGCTSLTKAPDLPVTTLADMCYSGMFSGCTSLTQAPDLPATTLVPSCYPGMFSGCTSLTQAPALPATTLADYCYDGMFSGCTGLTQAPALPATTLANGCYHNMFNGCTSLTQAPALPATTLVSDCYYSMFNGCTSLIQAPALPATTLADSCYYDMFWDCTSLAQAPALPATTLAPNCYKAMFKGCINLTQAPALPATTLTENCYQHIFQDCTSLTQAPALPATTLASNCYFSMFNGCTSLTKVPALPATTLAAGCYQSMFRSCTGLKLSSTQTGEYTQEYRIPSSGTGTTAKSALDNMFTATGGTFTGTPEINTTYYLSSDNMIVRETEIATLNGYVGSIAAPASHVNNTDIHVTADQKTAWNESITVDSINVVLPVAANWQLLAYGNGKFVAIAYRSSSKYAAYSEDGITWNLTTLPVSAKWCSLTYGNGKFVAIENSSDVAVYSDDGITWNQTTLPSSSAWYAVTYGNGKFVAIAMNSDIAAYSEDGIGWNQATLPISADWRTLAYGSGKFVSLGNGSKIVVYSEDGVTWTQGELPTLSYWNAITYGNGRFVATTSTKNNVIYSEDGISWTNTAISSPVAWKSIAYGNGKFVTISTGSNIAAYSVDGVTWVETSLPSDKHWQSLTYGGGKFVAVAQNVDTIAYSFDGVTWYDIAKFLETVSGTDVTNDVKNIIGIDSKQDKLFGISGQIIGFDENGSAVAQDQTPSLIPVVDVYSEDGVTYTGTLEGLTSYDGALLVFRPNMSATDSEFTVNINGIGYKHVYRNASNIMGWRETGMSGSASIFKAGRSVCCFYRNGVFYPIDQSSSFMYDTTPTANSNNFISSGNIKSYVDTVANTKQDKLFKPEGKSYLTFSSPNSFTLAVGDATKHWDGTLEYFAADKTWTTWDGTTTLSAVDNDGEYVLYLRGIGNTKITGDNTNYKWVLTGSNISCIGNIENLLDYATVESGSHPTMANYCYSYMFFGCTSLAKAPALPATTLADYCYAAMFSGCTSLIQAPALSATTLASNCYNSMFMGCTSLTQAPALPATTLANGCYQYMFQDCTALTQAPTLPATTLAEYCYASMFKGCAGLTQAPALPATTLANVCYSDMFSGCTSLIQAPALPATTLANVCYAGMFNGCTGLKLSSTKTGEYTQEYRIPSSGTGTTATNALIVMFDSTGGTFTGTPEINTTYYLSSDNMVVRETEIATLNGYVGSMIDAAIGNAIGGSY